MSMINEDLEYDGFYQQFADEYDFKGSHHQIALRVIEAISGENLLFSKSFFWQWNNTGVWAKIDDRLIKKQIHEHSVGELKKSLIDSVLDIIKTESFSEVHFDRDTRNINCENGELELANGIWVLRKHRRESYRTIQIPVAFDPEAKAPRFEKFLDEIFEHDNDKAEKRRILLELMGYTLVPTCEFERFALLLGSGANGKSVFLQTLEKLCGKPSVAAVNPTEFTNRFQRAHLQGKLANIVSEIAEGGEIADAQLKAIVSGELITAEHKHKPPFDFTPNCTVWFASNHKPHTRDFSDALFRRAVVLEFNQKFEGSRCDVNLKTKLAEELPGILNLALKHIAVVIERGNFSEDFESNLKAKNDWRLEADQAAQFVEEECLLDAAHSVRSGVLYSQYQEWANDNGINRKLNKKNFTTRLQRLGVSTGKGTGGVRMLFGVKYKHSLSTSVA